VKENLQEWQTIDVNVFPPPLQYSKKNFKPSPESILTKAKKIVSKLSDGDCGGALRLLISNDSVAPTLDETLASLVDKHPPPCPDEETPTIPDPFDEDRLLLDIDDSCLEKALATFSKGSAGGLDSLRPQILKDPTTSPCEASRKCLEPLKLLITGKVP